MPVGIEPGDLLAAGAGHDGEDLVVLVEDAQHGVLDLDGDGGAGVAKADRLALADDLDAAARRCRPSGRGRLRPHWMTVYPDVAKLTAK